MPRGGSGTCATGCDGETSVRQDAQGAGEPASDAGRSNPGESSGVADDRADPGAGADGSAGPSQGTRSKRRAAQDPVPPKDAKAAKQSTKPEPAKHTNLEVSLFVRWYSPMGKTKVNRLLLKPIIDAEALEGISKDLVERAFPEDNRPDYITSHDFYKFTPTDEFMSLPGDIARTEFRLVATYDGYEYTVLERELGAHRDPERKMLVTVIEFESTALMIGHLGVRVSLIAYPVVSVKKAFLDDIEHRLISQDDFKGIL